MVLEGERNRRAGIPPPRLGTRCFREELRVVQGPPDSPLPLWVEESPAPPIPRAVPWTPAAVASLFHGWDSARDRPPPPHGGSVPVACVEAATVTGGYGGGVMGP